MEITSKQKILNLSFEEDSSEEELPPLSKEQQNTISTRYGLNRGGELKFNTNLIKPGIFQQEGDDYHNSAIMTFPEPEVEKKKIEKEVQRKPRQISKEFEQITQRDMGIQIVNEIIHDNQCKQYNLQEESNKQNKKVQFQEVNQIHTNLEVSSSIRSSILNIDLDQSSSQSDLDTNGEEFNEHSQTIKLLALKPHQRAKVTFEEIALTHDPFENILVFSNKQIPLGKIINLYINRNQSGLNYLWPQFELYFQTGATMLYSKKMMANTTSNFYITAKKDISEVNDPFFIAKLRGNYSESVYQVYSKGINPKKGEVNKKIRSIEATIKFKEKSANMQPREFQVYTLAANTKYYDLQGVNFGEQLGLDQLYKLQKNKGKIFQFQNRKPIYSQAVEGFILNFGGRVQKASVKNFILQDSIAHREVMMLGKIDEDKFRVDISWPLKPYVAYCVCLANFDSKYTSE